MMLETMEMLRNLAFNNIAVGSGAATGDKVIKLSAKAKTEMVERLGHYMSCNVFVFLAGRPLELLVRRRPSSWRGNPFSIPIVEKIQIHSVG